MQKVTANATDTYASDQQAVQQLVAGRSRIESELSKVIVGQKAVIEQILIALFSGGHCLITGAPGMAVPASIIAGIGGILYYQNSTGDFGSWSYMWALIPGFVGIGTILAGLLGENIRANLAHGLNLLAISAVLFLVFGTFFGGLAILGDYGAAILLILLGLYVLARGFAQRETGGQNETR